MLEEDILIYMIRRRELEKQSERGMFQADKSIYVCEDKQASPWRVTVHPGLPITEGVLRTQDFQC